MATKFNLKIVTPHGEFTRKSTTAYTHAVVRTSQRAADCLAAYERNKHDAAKVRYYKDGVQARWVKDRGFAVTWHGSEAAARNAASKPYLWDKETGLATVYEVVRA